MCANVCHKDHDISYAKYGSFFCDCGAKEDGSCLALTKPTGSSKPEPKRANGDKKLKSLKAPTKQKRYKSVSSSSTATVKIDTSGSKVDKELDAFLSLGKQTTIEILKKFYSKSSSTNLNNWRK